MTLEEIKEAIEGFKKQGYTEEEIVGVFYYMYVDDAITLDELRTLTEATGWEFTEEFENMSEADKKKHGLRESEGKADEVDKAEVEDAKEYETGEDKDGNDDGKDGEAEPAAAADDKKAPEKDAKDEEEDDDKKAARLFGFGGKKD